MSTILKGKWKTIHVIKSHIVKIMDELSMSHVGKILTYCDRVWATRVNPEVVDGVGKHVDCVPYEMDVRLLDWMKSLGSFLGVKGT